MTQLETLLDRMQNCVKVADFSGLSDLLPALELALASLPQDASTLTRLKAKAERNAALLDAAKRGISAARRRLDEARRVQQGLQTYDGKGRREHLSSVGSTAGRF